MVGTTHSYISHCLARSVFPPPSAPRYQVQHISYAAIRTYTGHSDECASGPEKGVVCMCLTVYSVYLPDRAGHPPPFFVAPITAVVIGIKLTAVDRAIRRKAFESDIPRPSHYIGWRQSTTQLLVGRLNLTAQPICDLNKHETREWDPFLITLLCGSTLMR